MNDWVTIDLLDEHEPKIGELISVDTRDFHFIIAKPKDFNIPDLKHVKNVDYLTFDEVKQRCEEWKEKSGGSKKWRMIYDNNPKGGGWYKYIRIWRTEYGYLWCTRDNYYRSNQSLKNINFKYTY